MPDGLLGKKLPLQDENHRKHGGSSVPAFRKPEIIIRMGGDLLEV